MIDWTVLATSTPEPSFNWETWLFLIPLFPFLGFLFNVLFGKSLGQTGPGKVASIAAGLSFVCGLLTVQNLDPNAPFHATYADWFAFEYFHCSFGLYVDQLTSVMLLVVGGVGTLIHIYSIGYMDHDKSPARFFTYLNLFLFSMYLLILGDNLILLFVGWEGVGLCSYLLIGFWYEEMANAEAGQKAFVVNRIGDAGFLLGIFALIALFGTVNFADNVETGKPGLATYVSKIDPAKGNFSPAYETDVNRSVPEASEELGIKNNAGRTIFSAWHMGEIITLICILLFIGAIGKSAQIPLYVWLPDAMAGPTPVSALIHAATMVTAGVYMVARMSGLYSLSPEALTVVAVVGAATALLAALIGLTQTDIKKVLAYSTVSQLGYMFLGLGVGAYSIAVFHVVTHAFFKALLFMGAGAVIHTLHDEQDMRRMGGLRKQIPLTAAVMICGGIALAGFPFTAGWYSKDKILENTLAWADSHPTLGIILYAVGIIAAACTAFYTLRLILLTFFGESRVPEKTLSHLHKPGWIMLGPLVILAVLSIGGGAYFSQNFDGDPGKGGTLGLNNLPHALPAGLETTPETLEKVTEEHHHKIHSTNLMFVTAAMIIGLLGAFLVFGLQGKRPPEDENEGNILVRLSRNKFYVDEIYDRWIVKPMKFCSELINWVIEVLLIDTLLVSSPAYLLRKISEKMRSIQSGLVNAYAFFILVGAAAILILFLTAGGR